MRKELDIPVIKAIRERHGKLMRLLEHAAPLGSEAVHDVRVALRRLEEAVRLLPDDPGRTLIKPALREVRHGCGDVRDTDVLAEALRSLAMPAVLKRRAVALAARLKEERPRLAAKLQELLEGKAFTTAVGLLLSAAAEHAGYVEKSLKRREKKRRRQLREALKEASAEKTPEAIHGARIAAKKLRYLLELAADAGEKGAGKEAKALKRLQKIAGKHHDAHVLMGRLKVSEERDPAARAWRERHEREQGRLATAFFGGAMEWAEGFD